MAYTGYHNQYSEDLLQAGQNGCSLTGSAFNADPVKEHAFYLGAPMNDATGLYMRGLASSYEHCLAGRHVDMSGLSVSGYAPASTDGLNKHQVGFHGNASLSTDGLNKHPVGIHGNASLSPTYGFQNPLQEVSLSQQNIAFSQAVGMTSFPGDEMLTNQRPGSKSSKLKEKIRQLHPFYSRRLTSAAPLEGRTRTRDKYRVVYTEKQRLGLEKAYKEDTFITMAKKTELSKTLALSDRQIKIWFQNRRAKERRDNKKTSPDSGSESPESDKSDKPSCRFEKENVSPYNQQVPPEFPTLQPATQPGYPLSAYAQDHGYQGYDAHVMPLPPKTTSQKLVEPEITSTCPDVAHAPRFQISPSEWMEAYHQSMVGTVNVSPFSSSVNYLPRA